MNIVIKIGRLTSDPELRYTNSGKAVVNFNIATRKKFKQEGQKDADFFKCIAWNKAADFIANNIKKGGRIAIAGRTENNNYENQQGQIIRYDEIVIEDFEIIDFANSKGNQSSDFPDTSNIFGSHNQIDVKDEDLPF
ncbi:single-stranded DNA-binding protein [Vagococcus sp. DIV0080]|uniref:Single-stranded DNA-binding protein n=1 Tax=Candidatus Vagococcus giribetii TaxID=2230876 RepID=A0ABS3HXS1_9ENTE|nr:single-stranded DNA-binding protein [Vagococcus sp. DIV0080]